MSQQDSMKSVEDIVCEHFEKMYIEKIEPVLIENKELKRRIAEAKQIILDKEDAKRCREQARDLAAKKSKLKKLLDDERKENAKLRGKIALLRGELLKEKNKKKGGNS